MISIDIFLDYLDELFPNAHCELNYSKDYELLIAIMLSAQTTDKSVNKATSVLFNKYKTLEELKNANLNDVLHILRFLGYYENKAKYTIEIAKRLVDEFDGKVPTDPEVLLTFPGVGNKTKNCFLSEMYNKPLLTVDTHMQRVTKRLGICEIKDSPQKIEQKLIKLIPENRICKANHLIIWFGRYHCKALSPNCENCKIRSFCKGKTNY